MKVLTYFRKYIIELEIRIRNWLAIHKKVPLVNLSMQAYQVRSAKYWKIVDGWMVAIRTKFASFLLYTNVTDYERHEYNMVTNY